MTREATGILRRLFRAVLDRCFGRNRAVRTRPHALEPRGAAAPAPAFEALEPRVLLNGDPLLGSAATFAVGGGPQDVAVADFDEDGRRDLVTANHLTNPANNAADDVSLLLGNGDGTFQSESRIDVGETPVSLAVGDFDSDGHRDLAVANLEGDDVSILLGNGDGTFSSGGTVAAGDPAAVAAGDLNDDGTTDLVTANQTSDDVSVLFNTGDATFGSLGSGPFAAGNGPSDILMADLDGDGNQDVATADGTGDSVSVLLGNGDGTLDAPSTFGVGDDPSAIATGDLDGDGAPDLATANINTGDVSVLLGDGDGGFPSVDSHAVGNRPRSVSIADLDADGRLDLVAANRDDETISVLLGDGEGDFAAETTFGVDEGGAGASEPFATAVADLDGNGTPDVATANRGADDAGVLLNRTAPGAVDFDAHSISQTLAGTDSVRAVDLNGDDARDILLGEDRNAPTRILWFANQGDGTFGSAQTVTTSTNGPVTARAADLDGDGDADVLSASENDDTIAWYENTDGQGSFGPQQVITEDPDGVDVGSDGDADRATDAIAADLDGDDDLDVVSASENDDKIAWYENTAPDGEASFGGQQVINAPDPDDDPFNDANGNADAPVAVAAGDVDGDGDADLLSISRRDDKLALYENQGGGSFAGQRVLNTPDGDGDPNNAANGDLDGPSSLRLADLDGGDGLDVLVTGENDDRVAWYANAGDGTFGSQRAINEPDPDAAPFSGADGDVNAPSSTAITDLDGDGNADVVAAGERPAQRIVWYPGDGGGGFGPQRVVAAANGPIDSVAAADLDGDGRADVVSDVGSSELAWHESRGAAPIVVDSAADTVAEDGAVTLREAIRAANQDAAVGDAPAGDGRDRIEFAPGLAGETIALEATQQRPGELTISSGLVIEGPGREDLTIARADSESAQGDFFRVMRVTDEDPATTHTVRIAGVTLSNGSVADDDAFDDDPVDGTGVRNAEALTLADVDVANNDGGGVANTADGTLRVRDARIFGNSGAGLGSRSGSGIFNQGELAVRRTVIGGQFAEAGGGVRNTGTASLLNTTVTSNDASGNGGGVHDAGFVELVNSTIANNTSAGTGGGLWSAANSHPRLRSTVIADNESGGEHPDVDASEQNVEADFSFIESAADLSIVGGNNQTGQDPGLLAVADNGGDTLTHALDQASPLLDAGSNPAFVEGDQRGFGRVSGAGPDIGAFEDGSGPGSQPVTLTVTSAADDTALDGEVTLREAIEAANRDEGVGDASPGGSEDTITFDPSLAGSTITLDGPLSVTDNVSINGLGADRLTVEQGGSGPVFDADNGVDFHRVGVGLVGLTITGGTASGVQNREALSLLESAVRGNSEAINEKIGGGLHNFAEGLMTVRRSEVAGNTAVSDGGGIRNAGGLTIVNSTISNNEATGGIAFGGGVANDGEPILLKNSTVTANTATDTGGGLTGPEGYVLVSSIVADNTAQNGFQDDVSAAVQLADASLIQDTQGATIQATRNGTITGQDPQLGALADNGGPTRTHLPQEGSPVIDAGINTDGLQHDQRGFPRVSDAGPDMGAAETGGGLTIGDAAIEEGDDGSRDLAFAVTLGGPASDDVTFEFAAVEDPQGANPATAGDDFVAASGSGMIGQGESETTVSVPVNGDTAVEPTETFLVQLSNVAGAPVLDASAVGTITYDDLPQITALGGAVEEGDQGDTALDFEVAISGAISDPVTFDYETSDDTATAGEDYSSANGNDVEIPAGQTSTTVPVIVSGDENPEGSERFNLELSNVVNATGTAVAGPGVILGDDGDAAPRADRNVKADEGERVAVGLSKAPDRSELNLFDGNDAASDEPDLVVRRQGGNPVRGSLIVDEATNELRFIPSGGPLEPGTYEIEIPGRAGGVVDDEGNPLDGDRDGEPGGDFVRSFEVEASDHTLTLPSFARAAGQDVNVPATGTDLPVRIEDGEGVTSVSFTLEFDDALLEVAGVSPGAGLPGDWDAIIDSQATGQITVSASGSEIGAGAADVVRLDASVPSDASPGARSLLSLGSVAVDGDGSSARGGDALQVVSGLGDADADGSFSGLDASLIARTAVALDSGFDAFGTTDPQILGDADADARLTGQDASLVAREAVGLDPEEIPGGSDGGGGGSGSFAPGLTPQERGALFASAVTGGEAGLAALEPLGGAGDLLAPDDEEDSGPRIPLS